MEIQELAKLVIDNKAQTLHIAPNMPPFLSINGKLNMSTLEELNEDAVNGLVTSLLTQDQNDCFITDSSINFTYADDSFGRFRVTFYKQKGLTGAVMRPIPSQIPSIEELNLPDQIDKILHIRSGLIVIGGHAGSGKSSTLAAILNEINLRRGVHIVTIEDPIEYFFIPNKSLISQREVGKDSESFSKAIREATRQDADVIMIGEMRDRETVRIALNAAEAGTLVIGTMPTSDCVQTVTRLISMFPPDFQHQVRTQVSSVLKAVLCQQLVMRSDNEKRLPAVELMFSTQSIRSLIREQKFHQIYSVIESSSDEGMQTLDQSLQRLYKDKIISDVEVVTKAAKPDQLQRKMYKDSDNEIPPADTGPGFNDVGEDIIPIDSKIIRYRADFSPGQEGAWTSSVAVIFKDPGMILAQPPGGFSTRLYVSDFNIVSKRKNPFALPHNLLLRFKLDLPEIEIPIEEAKLLVKLFTLPPADKPTAFTKVNLDFPLSLDEKWHTWIIRIPDEAIEKMLKITMLEFPTILTKVSISDIIFF